jgi:hypothetical protein
VLVNIAWIIIIIIIIIIILWYWGLNWGPMPRVTPLALFVKSFFQDGVSWTSCLGWFWTTILLISAFWVARITGVSHQCPAHYCYLFIYMWYGVGTVLEMKPRALHIVGKYSTLSYIPSPCFFDIGSCCAAFNSFCSPGLPCTSNPPTSTSQVLRLQVCTTSYSQTGFPSGKR